MSTLVLADHDNSSLGAGTAGLVAAARRIGAPITVLVAGTDCGQVAKSAAALEGVKRVLVADDAAYANGLAEPVAALLAELAKFHAIVIASTGTTGKDVLPRAAALCGAPQISEIVDIEAGDTFVRSAYAGSALEVVRSSAPLTFLTVRASSFQVVAACGTATIETVTFVPPASAAVFVDLAQSVSERPDLGVARIVVSGGRAFGSKERFEDVLWPLADKLKAAVGASRAAVDAGYVSNDLQVGQTGRVVAPELYIACGISGAVQHLAGMKGSKFIVAINSDPEAPIFEYADFGLVGDIFAVLPELTEKL